MRNRAQKSAKFALRWRSVCALIICAYVLISSFAAATARRYQIALPSPNPFFPISIPIRLLRLSYHSLLLVFPIPLITYYPVLLLIHLHILSS